MQSLTAQNLPELVYSKVKRFTIPFEVRSIGTADPVKEVELLVSKDRGRHWHIADKQPISAKKFEYTADSEGEHWFAFRTVTASGNITSRNTSPQLRVFVETLLQPQTQTQNRTETVSGPVAPPKPQRFRKESGEPNPPETQSPRAESASETSFKLKKKENAPEILPSFPGLEAAATVPVPEENLLDDIFDDMSSFLAVPPAQKAANAPQFGDDDKIAGNQNTKVDEKKDERKPPESTPSENAAAEKFAAGKITGLGVNVEDAVKPQVIVRWDSGDSVWEDAQIDVLRAADKSGPWQPISINLPNKGEYWWFLTEEDMKPFYVAVRIRSVQGGTKTDTTREAVKITREKLQRK
ncbi:hypothetical protein FACS189419_01050 [Planctomycetales bacterium]|nr:hypothetical protein FACS189419_01050 [Planctomycetales bacterium]